MSNTPNSPEHTVAEVNKALVTLALNSGIPMRDIMAAAMTIAANAVKDDCKLWGDYTTQDQTQGTQQQ